MELEEEEAQICRLCGQYESIYIDVFGEEGTKRFLGLKIHTKVNILIDEKDPLPKAICLQCLGKLEFVCDFQEECLRTQQVLRDRYNLPPLTEIAEVKNETATPSTSANNNNNIEKNHNSSNNSNTKEIEQRVVRNTTKSQRNHVQSTDQRDNMQHRETPSSHWLRSRQNTDNQVDGSISSRLRSHRSTSPDNTVVYNNRNKVANENVEKQPPHTIQIPTLSLNKLLTIVSSSPDIEVSVKESRNRQSDAEDISFTVELCKKPCDGTGATRVVRARVFPDQGSCLVDTAIVELLENHSNVEASGIINSIIDNSPVKSNNSTESEQNAEASRNPEELFKIEGEEICVDDNVEHVVTDNQSGYVCKLCRKFYERKDKCTVHVKTHLGIKQYTCVLCSAKFVCKSDVMKHIRCSHTNPRPIQCPKCPKRFKSKFYLTEHDNVHKGVRPYTCSDCGQSYHHKVSLQIHRKSHLPPQNLACEYCGKVFPYRTRLLSHIASVHLKNRRNFRCRFCYNLYSSLTVLNEHIKTRHATTYTCEVCNKTFKVASKYKAHVLQHSNPKPFVCNVCNNRYASKAFLNEHLLKHEGLRKHVCQKCGASFAQASHLAAHRHVHGEKTHACPECGRKFNRRDNMKVHRKRHFEAKKTASKEKNLSAIDVPSSTTSNEKIDIMNIDANTLYEVLYFFLLYKVQENKQVRNDFSMINLFIDSTAVSIKIQEDDKLPKTVCVRCLGTLEFLCDFYDRCHFTQKQLITSLSQDARKEENDAEFDKENTAPSPLVKRKHRVNALSPTKQRIFSENNSILDSTKLMSNKIEQVSCLDNLNSPKTTFPRRTRAGKGAPDGKMVLTETESMKDWKSDAEKLNNRMKNVTRECLRVICMNSNERNSVEKQSTASSRLVFSSSESEPPVKKEDTNTSEIISHSVPCNQFTWTAKDLIPQEPQKPRIQKDETPSNTSPPPGDEAESHPQNPELNPVLSSCVEQTDALQNTSQCNTVERSRLESEFNQEILCTSTESSSRSSKSENGKFGKISELISDEQKSEIEKYYKVDMSVVDSKMVMEKLTVNDRKSIRCNICGTLYPRMDKCQVHIWGHLNMRPYKCTVCDFATVTVSNVRCHIRKSHLKIKPFVCHLCEKRYVTAVLLEEHLNIHTGARPFKCKLCDFASASRQVLSYHKTTHKPTKDIHCKVCGKEFYSRSRMRAHMLIHNKDKVVVCKICSAYLSNATALEQHIKNIHTRDYTCNICGKNLKSRKTLLNHKNVHAAAKYKCDLCPNVYKSSHILKEHLLKHEGIRKYKCNVCEKSFAQQSHLAAHMAVHSEIRYYCPGCNRAFNRQDNMKIHTRRCQRFLAKPELKELLKKKVKSTSFNTEDFPNANSKSVDKSFDVERCREVFSVDGKVTDAFGSSIRNIVTGDDVTAIDKTDLSIIESRLKDGLENSNDSCGHVVEHVLSAENF